MSLKIGTVHGKIEVIKIIGDVPHYSEEGKKGKIKWQATVVCPERMKTFTDFDGTDEEAFQKMKYNKD